MRIVSVYNQVWKSIHLMWRSPLNHSDTDKKGAPESALSLLISADSESRRNHYDLNQSQLSLTIPIEVETVIVAEHGECVSACGVLHD